MPFGGMLSLGAAGLSLGSGIAGLFGGPPANNVNIPQFPQYQNFGGADQGAFSGIQNLGQYNVPAQLLPQYQNIAQGMVNNPYASMYQQGSGAAGQMGMGSGMNAYGAGGQLTGNALSQLPNVEGLMSMGFDPQNALYSRTLQQVQDQTRAAEGVRGIAMSPYGAGLENDATRNFNIDWQNQQLGRAAQGAGAAGNLMGQIGQGVQQGQGLQAGAAGQFQAGAGMPYGAFQGINANSLGALGQAGQFGGQAAGLQNQQISDYLAYLSGAQGAGGLQNQAAGLQLNQANQGFWQNQQIGQNIGGGLAGIGNAWGKTGWGSPASWFGGGQQGSNPAFLS